MLFKKYPQVVSFLLIAATVYFSFSSLTPSFNESSVATTEFSNKKALEHLKIISQKPHFTGSQEHTNVREYLVNEFEKLRLNVEVQEQVAINKKYRSATRVKNIITKIKGTGNGKALLLLSHYDSNPHSALGASDAGSGVVVILEGVRSYLARGIQPKNDIIICISDAEELGLLGANAFVNNHEWAKDVGLVLNFEARGSGGPSYMLLETNGGNKKLIEAFQKAQTPFPVANSLMYSVYKMLPNDTDLTVFREDANINGFNFAFIGDHFDYHTAQDSFERMDLNSFQHQVSYLTATLNYFSNASLNDLNSSEDYVFFNFPYLGLLSYPFAWITPITIICVLLFFTILFVGFSKRKLTKIGVLKGFIPLLFSLVFSIAFAIFGWKLLLKIYPEYNDILHGFPYTGYTYIAGFSAFTLAITSWFYKGFIKKRTAQDLAIAPLLLWVILNVLILIYLKGAAFFSIASLVLSGIVLKLILSKNEVKNSGIITLVSLPILILFVPFIKMFPVGLGLKMVWISSLFIVLLFGFFVPVVHNFKGLNRLARFFLFIGLLTFTSAAFQSGFNENNKQPNSVFYLLDTNKNEAFWATYNLNNDAFLDQFFNEKSEKVALDKTLIPSKYKSKIKKQVQAPVYTFNKPEITVEMDTIIESTRKVRFNVLSCRNANMIDLFLGEDIAVNSLKINKVLYENSTNKLVFTKGDRLVRYYRTSEDEPLIVELEIEKNSAINLTLLESKFDLLQNEYFNVIPRSSVMMPMPFILNDATVIKTSIKI